jgi:hypothetical protein
MMPAATKKYLGWLIIDPAAAVYPKENPTGVLPPDPSGLAKMLPGIGLQKWGWWSRYLVAYLDGGYIPTGEDVVMGGTAAMPTMTRVTHMRTQKLYIPRQVRVGMTTGAGRPGAGYDVLEFKRGEPGYSPLCQVYQYGDPNPAMAVASTDLPKNAAAIADPMAMLMAAPQAPATYVYCLQVK